MARFAVLGATSWGLTLTRLLATHGDVTLLTRTAEEAAAIAARRGVPRLPGLELPPSADVVPAAHPPESLAGIVLAVPAQRFAEGLASLAVARDVPVLSAAKGIEHATMRRMSEVIEAAGWPPALVTVLSGPNLAHEVARGLPAASVAASCDDSQSAMWQRALSTGHFRVYRSGDVVGVELGGALKNVIAIAAGAAIGLGLGANAVATIMTRGLAEMTRLGVSLGANPLTFQGLAGVGDLAATCYSPLSRNHRLGDLLARGATPVEAAITIGETIEGAATAPVALELARRAGVEMPITEQVAAVLAGDLTVTAAMTNLLARELRPETGA